MTITDNRAAWQRQLGERLQIASTETTAPRTGEILVRNAAVGINPLDWLLQDSAMLPWLDYPAIVGSDVAGEVVAVGDGVDRFKVGDRVLGQAVGTTVNDPAQGAFQTHTIVLAHMAAPIPDALSFSDAAVLPLGLGTAACGLYQTDHLALRHPSLTPEPNGETLLLWGASSSVGCNVIQLAVASGYEVIATASPHNAEMVRSLGASEVFDHGNPNVVDQVTEALRGKTFVGAFHATGSAAACFTVVSRCEGRRFVTLTLPPPDERPASIEVNAIFGTSLRDNAVGPMIYVDFLPEALATGRYRAAPPARIVGHGLEAFQSAIEAQKSGTSGSKIVVDLG